MKTTRAAGEAKNGSELTPRTTSHLGLCYLVIQCKSDDVHANATRSAIPRWILIEGLMRRRQKPNTQHPGDTFPGTHTIADSSSALPALKSKTQHGTVATPSRF